jgi:biotin carboxyl carrier protein
LTFRIELDGRSYRLALESNGTHSAYALNDGEQDLAGRASFAFVSPGVYSVFLGDRSHTIYLAKAGDQLEVWADGKRRSISIVDPRDDVEGAGASARTGRFELRTPMPGKIIKVLVELHAPVRAGQGLVVVEAMKMQNEIKSPKEGVVSRLSAVEGATVGAGALLVTVE